VLTVLALQSIGGFTMSFASYVATVVYMLTAYVVKVESLSSVAFSDDGHTMINSTLWFDLECLMDHTVEVSAEVMAPIGGMGAMYLQVHAHEALPKLLTTRLHQAVGMGSTSLNNINLKDSGFC